ncbi:MAG: prolyl oligopeptidase family serine peptidase [Saprospiraceae bacterium]
MTKYYLYCILLSFVISASAQTSIKNLLSPPFPTELKSSADGKSLVWVFNKEGERNIFIAGAPTFDAKQLTKYTGDEGVEINSLSFAPNGLEIVFVRGNGNNNRNEAANPALLQTPTDRNLFIINKNGGNPRKIGPGYYPKISPNGSRIAYLNGGQVWIADMQDTMIQPKKLILARGVQSQIRWSPDGHHLIFVCKRGDHSFIGLYNISQNTLSYLDPSIDLDDQPVWSPDGRKVAFRRSPAVKNELPFVPMRTGHPWSIRVYDLITGKSTEVWKADTGVGSVANNEVPVADNQILWVDDNQLVFSWEKTGWQQLYALDLTSGKANQLCSGDGEVENIVLSKDLKTVFYTTNIGDIERRHIWKVDIKTGISSQISNTKNAEWSPVQTDNGMAILHASAKRPAWPALLSYDGKITNLAQNLFPAAYAEKALSEPKSVLVTATDGMQIPAQIFLPPNHKPGDKHPALIFTHGGSRRQMLLTFHYSQYYSNAYALNQHFASQGYLVMSLNYRSGIGYGMEFREALNYGAQGASEYFDLVGAGLYLKGRDDVAADKIALWGGSYGGYLTAHGLARASDLFACGVDIHGVHDWNEGIRNFVPSYNAEKLQAFAQLAYQSSPEYYIDGWKSPVLFIHGDDDRNVNFTETVRLAEMLRDRNVYFEQLVFPDEVHGFLLHSSWVSAYEAAFEFVQRQFSK